MSDPGRVADGLAALFRGEDNADADLGALAMAAVITGLLGKR